MPINLYDVAVLGKANFSLKLANGTTFICEHIIRIIPYKRFVCKGVWQQTSVYAKLFIGKNAKRYARRDQQGVEYLTNVGILTPDLLYAGVADTIVEDGIVEVLIFQAIIDSENAEVAYQAKPCQEFRLELATKLVNEIAKHHNANLLQTDLYLKNFLIKDDIVYTLDGDGIRHFVKLKKWQALENLSVLLSKFNVIELESWLPNLVQTYSKARSWQVIPDMASIKKLVNFHRKKVASQYADKKVFRNCTDVRISKRNRCFVAISSHFQLKNLPKTPQDCDELIQSKERLKSGNTCTVALAKIDGISVVIKRYNVKGFWHGVNRALRQTRAAISWANAHRLVILGIATATPVALIERRQFGFKSRAYFLSEYIDAPDIGEFFLRAKETAMKSEAILNVAKLFHQLFLLQISHGDMKASNIKLENNKPVLIDLDSMQQHQYSWTSLNAHVRDLQRFMQNWKESPALYNAFVEVFKEVYEDHQPLRLARIVK